MLARRLVVCLLAGLCLGATFFQANDLAIEGDALLARRSQLEFTIYLYLWFNGYLGKRRPITVLSIFLSKVVLAIFESTCRQSYSYLARPIISTNRFLRAEYSSPALNHQPSSRELEENFHLSSRVIKRCFPCTRCSSTTDPRGALLARRFVLYRTAF